MSSTPGDGQPPSDPYREVPAEPGPPSYGETPGQPPGPPSYGETPGQPPGPPSYGETPGQPPEPPGYWQQQSQPQYGEPQYGQQPQYGQPYPPYPMTPPNHGGALASMIVGIVALVLSCAYGFGLLASPVAWYLGSKSLKEIDESQGRLGGRGMAQAGKVMGIIGTILLVLLIVVVVVGIVILVAGAGSSNF